MAILEVNNLEKIYTTRFGGSSVQALRNVSFSVEAGEYVAIMGESGSGKTTLLNILAALDRPTRGKVLLEGRDITSISEKELSAFRRNNLGFVFQDFNLLDTFNLMDNILLPLVLSGKKYHEMNQRLKPLASMLGISELLYKYPYEVSAGRSSARLSHGIDHTSEADPGRRADGGHWIPDPQMIFCRCLEGSISPGRPS